MGETSKDYAESKRSHLVRVLESVKKSANNNFADMDISNNNQQVAIQEKIEAIVKDCQSIINELNSMSFE